ncbi:hypothetical protein AZ468_13655 [Vibrio europaeus]|uniref:Uncharacterized protein n=1 Tax=Vibrio europaeus TaxID=300876 RepID=A0A178JB39_9VIBR|nr:hypothetical protein AZ468_13655 [Vibrio europaeus]
MKATYQMLRKAMRSTPRSRSYWAVHQILQGLDGSDALKQFLLANVSMSLRDPRKTSYYLDANERLNEIKNMGYCEPCFHPAKVSGQRRPLPR